MTYTDIVFIQSDGTEIPGEKIDETSSGNAVLRLDNGSCAINIPEESKSYKDVRVYREV